MHIGLLKLSNNVILAPLAGITNLPFRLLAKKEGCSLVCSEMVSANGLVHNSAKTRQLMQSTPEEKPLSIQIFGSDPAIMAEAASIVAATGADIIDINFGCSVKKIVRNGAGAALMETPHKAEALIKSVRNAVTIPLTIKIRTGWEKSGAQALKLSEIAEACGVDAVTVHPRTATQGFRGQADRTVIAAVKQRLKIPVIGNGDIQAADDAVKMMNETGCDAVMIGRKAIGYPWIFSEILAHLRGQGESTADLSRRFDMMRQYLQASVTYCGEELACRMMRSRLSWFSKGMRNSSKFRESIKRIASQAEAEELITKYQESIEAYGPSAMGTK